MQIWIGYQDPKKKHSVGWLHSLLVDPMVLGQRYFQ